ncbi:MAG: glycosyltransferase family 2 protein [Bacteroidetes bacterium]|nr:glycosyltransferase family 2 protein [Bacteroidota bacterium]
MKQLKYFLWRIFKSPERNIVGWKTLFVDFFGRIIIGLNFKKLQPITICIGIKNRSENLLNLVLESLNSCDNIELITLSVFDTGSNDISHLENAIKAKWKGKLIYSKNEQEFTRSSAFNQSIMQAETDIIMACDADIYLPHDIVKKVNKYTTKFSNWFPIVWWQSEDKLSGRFFTEGTGIFTSTKRNFINAGMYDETFVEWGKEDWLLYFSFYKKNMACIRTQEKGMVHSFHKSNKPEGFKPLFN